VVGGRSEVEAMEAIHRTALANTPFTRRSRPALTGTLAH
jgi:hypothetical protein